MAEKSNNIKNKCTQPDKGIYIYIKKKTKVMCKITTK